MAIIKLTKNDIIGGSGTEKIKLKSENVTYDYNSYNIGRYKDYKKLGIDTLQSDLSALGNTIQGVYGGWQTEDTMKKTKSSVESMYNRLTAFQDYRKKYGIAEGDNEFNELVSGYKSILDGWDGLSIEYGQYKSADEYNKAIEDAEAAKATKEKQKTEDINALQKDIDEWQGIYDAAKKMHDEWELPIGLDEATTRRTGVITYYPAEAKTAAEKSRDDTIKQEYGYSLDELKKMVSEKNAYLKQTQVIQATIKLGNDAISDIDFEKYSLQGDEMGINDGSDVNMVAYYRNNPEIAEKYNNSIESMDGFLESVSKSDTAYSKYLLAMYGTDEEYKTYNYWYAKDRENGTDNSDKYLKGLADDLNAREGRAITEEYKDKSAIAKILGFGSKAGTDQFVTGIKNAFNFTDHYIPTTSTQYASQGIRRQLYDTGFDLPEWLGGHSFGQVAYDAVNTGANMLPSMAAGAVSDIVLPGSGTYVTAGLMGLSASGNAYQSMLNQGYSKGQSRTYATLVGASEALLSAALSGMIGGKATEKAIENVIKGIDKGLFRFAVRWGLEGVSEIPEESLQALLEPVFQNIALGYKKNKLEDTDWSQVAYDGLLGGLSGMGFGLGHSAINTVAEQSKANFAKKNYGQSQESVYALVNNGLVMPEGSVAHSQAVKADARLKSGKSLSGTTLYNLATAIEGEIETKSEARLTELGVDKKTAKELSPVVAKAVFGEKLNSAERTVLNNSEIAEQVVKELSADRANTVWKDAIKNSRINNATDSNAVTEQDEVLQSGADGAIDSYNNLNYNDNSIKEGESHNGKNTELLERGAVSATNRGDDVLRKQGTNSERLAACLEISQGNDSKIHQAIRAGESDWIDRGSKTQGQQADDKTSYGFAQRVIRKIQGVKLSGKDTIGGTVSSKILKKIKDTVLKDDKGNLISLYHWTQEIFEEFEKGEFGFHFGTLRAAYDRYLQAKEYNPNISKGTYKEVVLNITNPIELSDASLEWTAGWVAIQLLEKGIISERLYHELEMMMGFNDLTYDNPAAQAVRNILVQNGYDGIIYENLSEDIGSYSLIALYPEQIITVAGNGVLKENSGVSRAISENGVAFLNSKEKQANGIDADDFIQGLLGKDSNSATEQGKVLKSTAGNVADSGSDDIAQQSGQDAASAEIGAVQNNPDREVHGVVENAGNNIDSMAIVSAEDATQTAVKNVEKVVDKSRHFDDASSLTTTLSEDASEKNVKDGVKYKLSNIDIKDYDKFFFKKPIKVSKKELAKVNSARTQKYLQYNEDDIPDIDFFRIAEYNEINVAYRYYIRNYDKYSFEIVSKVKIKEVHNDARTTYTNTDANGLRHGVDSSGSGFTEYGQSIQSNDELVETGEQSNARRTVDNGGSDSRREIDYNITKATSNNEAAFSMPIGKRRRNIDKNVIELSKDNELSKKIGDLHGAVKYKVIQQYILDVIRGQKIVLSDGKVAVVDKSDAQHIARGAGDKKTTQISNIKKIIEKAVLVAEEDSTKERKFDYFYYYGAAVKYDGEIFNIYLNVGRATNDKSYHLYDITQKLRDTAHRLNDVGRPPINKGCAVETVSLNDIIPKTANNVNNDYSTNTDNIEYERLNDKEQNYIRNICDNLGRAVVFEDLRDMYYKGEIISPDGYIENGVIHLNTYAENPIGFVFKHELTHFAEKASGYAEFVCGVKNSNVYKKWLCEKMGESDIKIAEYKYKQMVANTHSDIYSASDPKAEAEMIADFVGEMLFTENGSGMLALTAELDTKPRNAVVRFITDFISWLKKKFINGQSFMTYQLSVLEDGFNRLLSEATNLENNSQHEDNNVKFSIAGEHSKTANHSLLFEAKLRAYKGDDSETIRKDTGWYKGRDGKWRYYIPDNELNIDHLIDFANSNEDVALLGDVMTHDKLFAAYPELRNVRIRFDDIGQTKRGKFSSDKNEIVLNIKLKDNVEKIKDTLVHETQHAIQYTEGFALGGNKNFGFVYAMNLAYDEVKNTSEFKRLNTKEGKYDLLVSVAKKIFNAQNSEELRYKEYRSLYGEVEARQVTRNRLFDEEVLRLATPDTSGNVVDVDNERIKFVENFTEMGYTEEEVLNLFRGEQSDKSGSIGNIEDGSRKNESKFESVFRERNIGLAAIGIDAIGRMDERGTRNDGRGVQSKDSQGNNTGGMVGGIVTDKFSNTNISNQKADSKESAFLIPKREYIQTICDKLGRAVVFEDLRDMYYKGEIISPDGYIENGVIHLNTYAENPIGFVFKHELTHFAEKASGYAEFVRGVKNSNVYKKWLCEKMGESDIKIAEYKYKQMVANTHSDIYSASDPKAEAEMIADFVGEMLFTENGSGMASLVSDVEVKQRNKVVQFMLDLISYLKKKLSGMNSLTLELSRLEDRFNALLYENEKIEHVDNNIRFSFNNDKTESSAIITIIKKNIEKISDYSKFIVQYEELPENITKSNYVLNIFKTQGEVAYNKYIGKVELTKSGAKSTVFHGFGKSKLAATKAIKSVIEHGNIISITNNYNNTGIDRSVIAAKGVIDDNPAYIGVVVKAYPNNKKSNAKFYLHEALIIETASPIMTATQLNADTVSETASNNIITNSDEIVNYKTPRNTDNIEYERLNDKEQNYIQNICDKLGRTVVFEDLREMYYKGEIISPDGYIENGIIHLNLYAENPIGFVFKHELTHFVEKASGYSEFVRGVKNSNVYKKWLCEKMGESDIKIAEYKYKQMVANTHSDIYSASDLKAEAEMIADFVGEMLFTENGSGMASLVSDVEVKHRNKVVRFVLDLISWLKKKLSGMNSLTLELSRLEDRFNELLSDIENIVVYDDEVKFSFGITQKDIDDYVDAAYKKENTEDYKKYAVPTQKLIDDVSNEIDITDYSHALRDNDIRHIKNSHGEGTNEKYPVTSDDIKLIPWIVQNYDKVFVKTNSRGKPGVLYVKVAEDNVIYYVEAVTEEYHTEKLLVNKQMIKTGIDDIPNLYGLNDAINKKMSSSQYLADLKKIRKAYVRDVKENYSDNIIPKTAKNVNNDYSTNTDIFDDEVRFSLKIKHANSTVEEIKDARNLTDEQAVEYLKQAKRGELRRETYIPIRKDTPSTIINTLGAVGIDVQNRSLIMQVRKAQQAMSSTNNGSKSKKHGNNIRSHGMSAEQIVDIVKRLDNPTAMILQTNRYNQYGEELPDNVAVFVEYNNYGKEGVAIVEFDSSIDSEFIGTEFGDANYHTVVTIFEPDTERYGMPFDYIEELLANPDNYELEIVRRQPARSATGEKHPNTSSELPSSDIIFDDLENVNNIDSTNTDNIEYDAISEQEQKFIQTICDKLGRTVVFEDLREMYYKGEIISPDGYIENGVIHLNTYAENPIGFVFKHELTHFAEKASGYLEFVRGVKNSNVYKKWLCEKMGESDIKIAEYKYKQMVANIHSDIYSASDPKAEAEMIADFVGEMLFTENGSGMASLVSDVEVKQRNKVVQFVLDLISYLKKKLSGINSLTLELSILEDSFNRIVSEATDLENKGLYKYDNDISFCFVACTDQDRINAAEELERQGYNRLYIFKNCGLIRDAYGKWKYELNTREFKFYPDGNARTDSHYFNYKLQKPDGSFEGRLCDFVLFNSLFELYPQLKDITVIIKKADDTVRFIIDKNDENDKEPILFINKRLSDDFKSSRNNDIKSYILRELQRAIQHINGEYIGKSLTYWENKEKEGKTPYSEKLGRKLTAQEAHKYTADNYEAKIVETRRALRDTILKTDANKGRNLSNIDEAYLYSSSVEKNMDILFDDNDNPFISKEYFLPSKDNSISDNKEGTTAENEVVPSLPDGTEENGGNSFEVALKKNQNSNKLRRFLSAARMIDKNDIAQNLNIRAGSDSLISNVADNAKQAAEYFNQDRINELSQKILQRIDSIGRALSDSLLEKFKNTIFKNEKGQMTSLYTLKMRGVGGFEHSKLGLVAGTLEAAEQLYEQYNDGSPRNRDVYIQEIFVNMKNPLVLNYTPYEDSIRGIHDLVEREILFHSEFINLINQKSAAKEPTYSGLTTRKTREAIQNAGYDGIIYFNDSTDKGSMTVIVFDESQMITVAENGILQQNNGIMEDYFDLAAAEDAAKKVNNDKNIKLYTADSKYNKRKYRPVPDERIKAGNSGFMEKVTRGVVNAKRELEENLAGNNEIALSGKDTVGRTLGKKITGECDKTFFKDKNGTLLSFFAYGKKIIDLEKAIKSRTFFGTLNSAINDLVLSKEKSPRSLFGVIQEFYINSVAPLIVELDNLDVEAIAKQIFEEKIITEKEYYRIISPERKNPALVLINKLDEKGFDCIVFAKQTGECAVLPFDASQVFPVADNGIVKENSNVTQVDEIEEYNENYRIDRVVIEREGETPIDTQEIRNILTTERDNTIKMKLVTKVLMCNNNPAIDYSDNRTAGHSGILEKNKVNILNARAIVTALINRDFSDISIADTDTAGRIISERKRKLLRESKFLDKDGRPLSVFGFNRYGDYRFKHSQFGLRVGTLNAAHDTSLFERENSAGYISGSFEEYYPIVKNPYFLTFDPENLTPAMLAKYLLEEGTITNKQYESVFVRLGADRTAYHSGASNYLTRILKEKGIDSLAFMNERADPGSIGLIVFDKSQLIPVAIDGLPVENSDRTLADSDNEPAFLIPKNANENFVEKGNKNIIDGLEDNVYNKKKKKYLNRRPSYGKNQLIAVWNFAKKLGGGKVIDPTGKEIVWDTSKARNGQWDMGHIPGQKYSEMHKKYLNDEITEEEFVNWYRDPKNYRPELPSTNRSHKYE